MHGEIGAFAGESESDGAAKSFCSACNESHAAVEFILVSHRAKVAQLAASFSPQVVRNAARNWLRRDIGADGSVDLKRVVDAAASKVTSIYKLLTLFGARLSVGAFELEGQPLSNWIAASHSERFVT